MPGIEAQAISHRVRHWRKIYIRAWSIILLLLYQRCIQNPGKHSIWIDSLKRFLSINYYRKALLAGF